MRLSGFLYWLFAYCFWRCVTSTARAATQLRWIKWISIGITLASVAWLCRHLVSRPQTPVDLATMPMIQQIRGLSELVTAKVTIADVRETKLSGYLGDVNAVLIIRGEVLLGPDLSHARIISCDEVTRAVTIELPPPHLISCRLDHDETKLVSLSHDGLWLIVPGDAGRTAVLNRAYREAERAVADAAMTPDTLNEAAAYAKQVLEVFFATGGWKIQVRWLTNH